MTEGKQKEKKINKQLPRIISYSVIATDDSEIVIDENDLNNEFTTNDERQPSYIKNLKMNDFVINFFGNEVWQCADGKFRRACELLDRLKDTEQIWKMEFHGIYTTKITTNDEYFKYVIYCDSSTFVIKHFDICNDDVIYQENSHFAGAMNAYYGSEDYARFYKPILEKKNRQD